jgi:hypothetical protein
MMRFENDDLGYLAWTEGVLFQALRNCRHGAGSAAFLAFLGGAAACWIKPATPDCEKRMAETFAAAANPARLRRTIEIRPRAATQSGA